jgi:hypothetical protein
MEKNKKNVEQMKSNGRKLEINKYEEETGKNKE